MTAHARLLHRLVIVGLTGFIWGCGGSDTAIPPTNSTPPTAPTPVPSPPAVGEWSGTVELSSASPAASCPVTYVESHPELFAQSASAKLEVHGSSAQMELRTAGGQKCVFSGTYSGDQLTLSARHETCDGYPLSVAAILGIVDVCKVIDPIGDGPFWGDGTLVARVGSSDLGGNWTFEVFDPGATGSISIPATRFSVGLHVHLVP